MYSLYVFESDEIIEPTIDILRDLTFLEPEIEENQFVFSDAPCTRGISQKQNFGMVICRVERTS